MFGVMSQIHEISASGEHSTHKLGDPLQDPEAKYLVQCPGSSYFASELSDKDGYALYNCIAAPGLFFIYSHRNMNYFRPEEHAYNEYTACYWVYRIHVG